MKLIIQIPCFNEAATLGITLSQLPRHIDGFSEIEWLIIDDGSDDNTAEIAKKHGVDHIVTHNTNKGLAAAFTSGLSACLNHGADVIVNTDADNQYDASCIKDLVKPILENRADIVVGTRPIDNIQHFSKSKKLLQKIGSWVTRMASNTEVADAPSGFRAITRNAAQNTIVFSKYSYTLETIIQAGQKNLSIVSVPVNTNEDLRPSKLVKSIFSYIKKSCNTIIRIFVLYRPFQFFISIAAIIFSIGFLIGLRFVYYYFIGEGDGHIQSLILSAIFIIIGFQTALVAFLADLLAANRKLLEDIRIRLIRQKDRHQSHMENQNEEN